MGRSILALRVPRAKVIYRCSFVWIYFSNGLVWLLEELLGQPFLLLRTSGFLDANEPASYWAFSYGAIAAASKRLILLPLSLAFYCSHSSGFQYHSSSCTGYWTLCHKCYREIVRKFVEVCAYQFSLRKLLRRSNLLLYLVMNLLCFHHLVVWFRLVPTRRTIFECYRFAWATENALSLPNWKWSTPEGLHSIWRSLILMIAWRIAIIIHLVQLVSLL